MALETFNFPYHVVETTNPESGYRGQLGGSYTFTSPPTDPDQRVFNLSFPVMKFFVDSLGVPDALISPEVNMMALIRFYQTHKLHQSFIYNHPVHGQLEVKFNKPLVEPAGIPAGGGAVEKFTVELIEIV